MADQGLVEASEASSSRGVENKPKIGGSGSDVKDPVSSKEAVDQDPSPVVAKAEPGKDNSAKPKVSNTPVNKINDGPVKPESEQSASAKSAKSAANIQSEIPASGEGNLVDMQAIKNIKVKVQAILGGISMPVSQLTNLRHGELIALDTHIGDVVEIVANGQSIAQGEIVVIEDNTPRFGITVTSLTRS